MRFRLRTFFIVTTIVSVVVGFMILRYQKLQKLKVRYDSFEQVARAAGSLSLGVKKKLVSIPAVESTIQPKSPMTAEDYLTGGYGGSSSLGSLRNLSAYFEYDFNYQWPDAPGSYSAENSIDIILRSALDRDATTAHVLTLEYSDTEFNRIIADWIAEEIAKDYDVEVQHQKTQ